MLKRLKNIFKSDKEQTEEQLAHVRNESEELYKNIANNLNELVENRQILQIRLSQACQNKAPLSEINELTNRINAIKKREQENRNKLAGLQSEKHQIETVCINKSVARDMK